MKTRTYTPLFVLAAGLVLIAAVVLLLPKVSSASGAWLTLNPYSGTSGGTVSVPQQPAGSYSVTANGKNSGTTASAPFYIQGYYPKVSPSAWYLMPGQTLSFSGSGFAPYEVITLTGTVSFTITADQNGNFFNVGSITVPYSWQNNTQQFTFTGNRSAYSVNFKTSVGSFYPNLEPSTYYVGMGQGMNANVTGFAPGETVQLQVNGTSVGQQQAGGSGNAGFTFNAPSNGSTFALTAVGLTSGRTVSRTVTLH